MVTPAAQRARLLAPGAKLGKHQLIRQIAVGGMAELYLARSAGLEGFEKLVVLKRILPQLADNASFVTMFLNEARLAATLHHPNIAQVFDIGQDGTDYFFSMEYVHGQDLGHLVASATASGVPISLDAALTLVAGLCAGLHYAHEKVGTDGKPLHVVHRDVSPSNVLVSYDGAVKLVDFGIARAGSNPSTTRSGLKGKIGYMSPEQCRGKVALDRRSDVFSIGAILYELTAGRMPFTDETEYGILNQIVNRDAEPPSRFVAGYSPALEAIVMRALARNPDQRYATALELQKAIEDYAHENRLRVSPLVLARLMSTLFPARLEEWDHARAQGAFFVEQHVVRTLIESVQGDGAAQPHDPSGSPRAGSNDDASATGTGTNDTVVGPPPVQDPRAAGALLRPPAAGLPPARGAQPGPRSNQMAIPSIPRIGQPASRASSPAVGQPAPPRASSPVVGQPAPPRAASPAVGQPAPPRASSPAINPPAPPRAATPPPAQALPSSPSLEPAAFEPVAFEPAATPHAPRMATPVPGRLPTPIPGVPGAVPIVTPSFAPSGPGEPVMPGLSALAASQPGEPVMPGLSALAASQPVSSANPARVFPVDTEIEVTERVRVRPKAPRETMLVQIPRRSRAPLIIVAMTCVAAAAVVAFTLFGDSKDEVAATRSEPAAGAPKSPEPTPAETKPDPAAEAKAAQPDPAQPDPAAEAKAAQPDPAQPDPAAEAKAAQPDPAQAAEAKPAQPDPAQPDPAAEAKPAPPDPAKVAQPDPPQPDPAKPGPALKPPASDTKAADASKAPKKPSKLVRPPKSPKPPRVGTAPKKDPKKVEAKPDPKSDPPATKEPKWTPDSPFLPVRPPEKK